MELITYRIAVLPGSNNRKWAHASKVGPVCVKSGHENTDQIKRWGYLEFAALENLIDSIPEVQANLAHCEGTDRHFTISNQKHAAQNGIYLTLLADLPDCKVYSLVIRKLEVDNA